MYVERHQYELTKSQILEKAHLNSADDIVLLSGSRAAGLEHEHSDYDAVVVTSGPIPDSRAAGTKFFYGVEPRVVGLDIMYLAMDEVLSWAEVLEPGHRGEMLRLSYDSMMDIWRIVRADPIFNEEGLSLIQERFDIERVDRMVLSWSAVRSCANMLAAFEMLGRGHTAGAWSCGEKALIFAAQAACARHGDSYPNHKFVHEKCQRISHLEPTLLDHLWHLESTDRNSVEADHFLNDCAAFCQSYVGFDVDDTTAELIEEAPLRLEPITVVRDNISNYIIWNKADVYEISDNVTHIINGFDQPIPTMRTLAHRLSTGAGIAAEEALEMCVNVVRRLEEFELVQFDWLGVAEVLLEKQQVG